MTRIDTPSDETRANCDAALSAFEPRRWHLVAAAATLLVIYAAGVSGKWWPTPDSALYQSLGRSIARGDGYVFNGQISTRVTPGVPMILAGLRLAFGRGYWAPNAFVAACGLGTLLMAYLTLARLGPRRMALAAVLATGISYTFFFNSHLILTDTPFALLLWCAMYAAVRQCRSGVAWLIALALAVMAGIFVRAPGGLLLGSVAVGLMLDRTLGARRRRIVSSVAILAAAAIAAGALLLMARAVSDGLPPYLTRTVANSNKDIWFRLGQLGVGVIRLPEAYAEMFTSQEGLTIPFGIAGAILAVVGGAAMWRSGRRLMPVSCLLYMASLCLIKDSDSIKPRHLMSIQPMLAYLGLAGVCWCIRAVNRWRSRTTTARALLTGVSVFVGIAIVTNLPRLSRNAFYYGYYSHTPRYYEIIRDRDFVDLFDAAEAARSIGPAGSPVAVDHDQKSILHFLTDRVTVPLPQTPQQSQADAEAIVAFVAEHPEFAGVVVDITQGGKGRKARSFTAALESLLSDTLRARQVFAGPRYRVYAIGQ